MTERSFKSLSAYKKAFSLAMDVFETSKSFPKEEKYSLTDQVRRCSRSVAACIAEAFRKKMYEPYFVSKVSDADMENSETRVWLDFSLSCGYIDESRYRVLDDQALEIGKLLNHMIGNPKRYCK